MKHQSLISKQAVLAAPAILVTLSLWSCTSKESAGQAPAVTVQVATVQRVTIERNVTAEAILYPLRQAAIVPKISAPVTKFYVERGSRVRAGQLLAELESRDLAAAVTESRGAYEQAQAAYQTAIKAALPEEMQKAQLDLEAAKKALDAQQNVFDSRRSLYQQGAIPRKDVEDAGVALIQARNQYEIAENHFKSLESVGNADERKAAEGELTAANGRYQAAQAQMAYAQIRSPIDGVVTDRPLYAGEMAAAGSPLITVMDLSRIIARAHIAQQEAALLNVGDEAVLAVPGIADEVPARVTVVSPALDPNSTTVEIWAEAANSRGGLQPGTSARATFVAETVKDALVIPAAALITGADGAASVIVATPEGKPQSKAVKVGIRQGPNLQIVDGLHEGDRVVTQGAFEIAQEDPDVLAKTKLQIITPESPDQVPDQGSGKNADSDKK